MTQYCPNSAKLFFYNAFDPKRNEAVRGGWWAGSREEVQYWLLQQNFESPTIWVGSETPENVRVNRKELAHFFRKLSVLFNSGSPLDKALQFASQGEDRKVAAVAGSLSHMVSQGYRLSRAMETYPSVFSKVVVGLVAAGEMSGALNHILNDLADAEERALQLEGEVKAALSYPAVLSVVTLLVTGFFVFYVLPMDQEIFGGLGLELPFLNRVLIQGVHLLGSPLFFSILMGFVVVSIFILRRQSLRTDLTRHFLRVVRATPFLKAIFHQYRSAQHLQLLRLLLRGGGSVVLALQYMASSCILPEESAAIESVRKDILDGCEFHEVLESSELFDRTTTALLTTGHEAGKLETMAYRAQRICQESVQNQLETASALLEPALMTLAGLMAGFVVLSSALPMLQLIQNL